MIKLFLIVFLAILTPNLPPLRAFGSAVSREYGKADQMFSQGKYQDALRLYKTVLDSPSNMIPPGLLFTRIADCFFKLSDYERALDAYRNALNNQKPAERAQTQYWIGFCTFLLGRDAEAVNEFLRIPLSYPDSGMWVGTAYYWAGRASERIGKKEDAADFYRKAGGKGQSTEERFALKKASAVTSGSGVKDHGPR